MTTYRALTNFQWSVSLFIGALCLRLFHLDSMSLWQDEGATAFQINHTTLQDAYRSVMSEGFMAPLSHLSIYLFSKIAGLSEWALRFPSALYGSLSVVVLYYIGMLLFKKRSAVIGAILFLLSPLHIWYSQEARMYSLWVLLTLLLLFLFLKILKLSTLRTWILFTLIAVSMLWTHLNSIYIFAAIGIYFLLYIKRYTKEFISFIGCMFVITISYIPGILAFFNAEFSNIGGMHKTGILDLIYAIFTFNVGTSFGPPITEIRSLHALYGAESLKIIFQEYGIILIPSALFLLYLILCTFIYYIKDQDIENRLGYLIPFFIPSLFIFLTAFFSNSVPFNVRYILYALPLYLLLIGHGIEKMNIYTRFISILILLLITGFSLYNHYYNPIYSKVDLRGAIRYLDVNIKDKDAALIFHESVLRVAQYYAPSGRLNDFCMPFDITVDKAIGNTSFHSRMFFVKSIRIQKYRDGVVDKTYKYYFNNFKLEKKVNFNKIEITIFRNHNLNPVVLSRESI
ncbi:MAG: glycosyltransferase family 39 protein [Spirochaetota bacterium]|nr:glycosyltransferase family 39 protein [Spirochaetota bacterium]